MSEKSLKYLTARSVKWNTIDRLATQVLYALTGVVLANILSPDDFGLVGAVAVFQAFASIFIDSGFSYALIQRKYPTRLDYSSVLWFNMGMAAMLYLVLYACAPLISDIFRHDSRLIPLSRVMFLTFILNASSIVQVNRLVKQMNVRPVAVANAVSLAVGGAAGIVLAVKGYGAWALVWQAVINSGLKSLILWVWCRWMPMAAFSWTALRSFFGVGGSMLFTSTLNTFFQQIYSFIIGNRAGMAPLGYYTQGDKWSKMGIMSILQTFTSSFLPSLSAVQDDPVRFRALCGKMNRMTGYILFPVTAGLCVMAPAIFHTLFGEKWDPSVFLFQLLMVRGIFTVLNGVYNNYILALGRSRLLMGMEVVRDGSVIIALAATYPFISLETAADMLLGIRIMLYGQIAASAISWVVTLVCTCRATGAGVYGFCRDLAPYAALTLAVMPAAWAVGLTGWHPATVMILQALTGGALYVGLNYLLRSKIQTDVFDYISGRLKK